MHPVAKYRKWLPTCGEAREGQAKELAFSYDLDLNSKWQNAHGSFENFPFYSYEDQSVIFALLL